VNSRIYVGTVMHARFTPVAHKFSYPLYMLAVDLDDLEQLDREVAGFGYNRRSLVSLRDDDYLDGDGTIRERLARHLGAHAVDSEPARVEMVTMPRVAGYCFNPVSFYYCYKDNGEVSCVVAEVNNTFDERHLYILNRPVAGEGSRPLTYLQNKEFHVSPFNNMAGDYCMVFSPLDDRIRIQLDLRRDGETVMRAVLRGKADPLDSRSLRNTLMRYPLAAALTFPRICYQAALLHYRRKLPVNHKPPPSSPMTIKTASPSRRQMLCAKLTFRMLSRIKKGQLRLLLPDRSEKRFGDGQARVTRLIDVKEWRFFTRLVGAGDVGFGEAFTEGDWETDDLTGLIGLLIANMDELSEENGRFAWVTRLVERWQHAANRNTRKGSRRNIEAHYDLGNDFYETFLDRETMMYSCGLSAGDETTLTDSQKRKLKRIVELADIGEDDHVLEIGFGWGGFAIAAARETGCRVTGLTLSKEQFDYAKARVDEEGLADRIDLRMCDYRDVNGTFDRIVSIEMLEAVGHEYYGSFFSSCDRVLAPGGRVVLQVITIPDQRYDAYRRRPDWIQKHIFPGGMLPSLTELSKAMTRHSAFQVEHLDNIGKHYAQTLRQWAERFNAHHDELLEMGYDEEFQRKWNYYLSYCEAGFAARYINDLHLVLARPGAG